MKFTLIIATLGRSHEVINLFESLLHQTYKEFSIILIDQNSDYRVHEIYDRYKYIMKIHYVHTEKKGLSHARNIGLENGLNDIIVFPDDDCWYAEDILEKVNQFFETTTYDIISGQPIDSEGKALVNNYLKKDCDINLKNVWNTAISFTVFFKRDVVSQVGKFDEHLGVGCGTVYGSGEETDYLIRALKKEYKMRYVSDIQIFHPRKIGIGNKKEFERAVSYGAGMGYVLKKHNYDFIFKLRSLIRPLGGAFLALLTGNLHMYKLRLYTFWGRLKGMRAKF